VGKATVASLLPEMVDTFTHCLGFAPTRPYWRSPGWTWDLLNGGQVNLVLTDATIMCEVWSKRRSDIERKEIRLGMTPEDESTLIG